MDAISPIVDFEFRVLAKSARTSKHLNRLQNSGPTGNKVGRVLALLSRRRSFFRSSRGCDIASKLDDTTSHDADDSKRSWEPLNRSKLVNKTRDFDRDIGFDLNESMMRRVSCVSSLWPWHHRPVLPRVPILPTISCSISQNVMSNGQAASMRLYSRSHRFPFGFITRLLCALLLF